MKNEKIALIAEITILPGFESKVLAAAKKCAIGTNQEPGCEHYILSTDKDKPERIIFYETFRSKADFAHHCSAPHTVKFIAFLKGKAKGGKPKLTYLKLYNK